MKLGWAVLLAAVLAAPAFASIVGTPTTALPEIARPRPAYLVPVRDSAYAATLLRVAGDAGTTMPNMGAKWGVDARHHYSKDQPWDDADGFVKMEQRGGTPSQWIADGATWAPLFGNAGLKLLPILAASTESRWCPSRPGVLLVMTKDDQFVVYNMNTRAEEWRYKFSVLDAPDFGWRGEGTITDDGTKTVMGSHYARPGDAGKKDYAILIDIAGKRVSTRQDLSALTLKYTTGRAYEIGNMNISTRGDWIMAKMASTPEYGYVWHVDWATLTIKPEIMRTDGLRMKDAKNDTVGVVAHLSHADMNEATNPKTGEWTQVVIGGVRDASYANQPVDTKARGTVWAVDLSNGLAWPVSIGTARLNGRQASSDQHTSGRAYKRRGWHVVTYELVTGRVFSNKIVAFKTDGSGEHLIIGDTRTNDAGCYRCEAHAVPNPDLTKVMFASSWSVNAAPLGPTSDVKAYVYDVTWAGEPPPVVLPPPTLARYYVDPAWSVSGAVIDRTTGRVVPLSTLSDCMNTLP